jgi:hypothetical protein
VTLQRAVRQKAHGKENITIAALNIIELEEKTLITPESLLIDALSIDRNYSIVREDFTDEEYLD